jgi:hypothetical protein
VFVAEGKNIKICFSDGSQRVPLVLLVRTGKKRSGAFEGEGNKMMGVGLCEHRRGVQHFELDCVNTQHRRGVQHFEIDFKFCVSKFW